MAIAVVFSERTSESHKAVADALMEKELSQRLARLPPVGEFLTDSSGGSIYVNEKLSDLSGLSGDSVLGYGWVKALHPDDRVHVTSAWREAVENRTTFEAEYRFVRPDGDVVWVKDQAATNFSDDGQFLGHFGTTTEITTRKQAENLFRAFLESTPDAMVVLDNDGSIALVNTQALSMFGYSREELLSKTIEDLVPMRVRAKHLAFREAFLKSPRARPMGGGLILNGLRSNGTVFSAEVSLGPIETSEGTFVSVAIRDVTARRTAENQLRKLQNELNRASRWSMAGMLGATLAHELNQPMTAVMNYVRASQRILEAHGDRIPESAMGLMAKAIEQTDFAGKIVQNLRRFVERDELEYVIADVNLVVREVSAVALPDMERKDVNFRFHPGPDLPLVLIDRVQIQQVIENLFRNAVEAMSTQGDRELIIETSLAENGFVEVTISDSGPGVSPKVVDSLFTPFATTKTGGMGVGLAISQSIILAHGGRLWTEPNPGGGVFRFTVPVASANGNDHE